MEFSWYWVKETNSNCVLRISSFFWEKKKYLHNTYMGIISSINISERFWWQSPQGLREWTCLVSSHWISPAPYFHKACSTTWTPAPMVRDIRQSRYVGQREGQGLQVTGRVTRSGLGNGDLRESKCRHRILKRMSNRIACRVRGASQRGDPQKAGWPQLTPRLHRRMYWML